MISLTANGKLLTVNRKQIFLLQCKKPYPPGKVSILRLCLLNGHMLLNVGVVPTTTN